MLRHVVDTLDHAGIVYRGPGHDRRAALAGGPDVWEIVTRLRELEVSEEERRRCAAPGAVGVRFLLDEMFPRAAATLLRDAFDRDALHVGEVGLSGAEDSAVATFARSEHRAVVTENIADCAPEPDLVLACVLKRKRPSGGPQAQALAELLDRWATENSDPYVGQHWPT